MAQVLSGTTIKSVGDTVSGELYRVGLRDSYAICITIEQSERPSVLVGGLQSPEFDRPSWFHLERSTKCLSFGVDWVIEPIVGDEAFPHRSFVTEDVGVLIVQGEDAALRFDRVPDPNHYDYVHVSLTGKGRVEREANAVPYRQWRIWMSIAERDRPNGRPLVAFG